jgi:hypothetical protein
MLLGQTTFFESECPFLESPEAHVYSSILFEPIRKEMKFSDEYDYENYQDRDE